MNDLNRGLVNLDRQVRRDRMKKEYRSPSVAGGSSIVSGVSTKSGATTSTSRSYKRTGFEGGALNAIMGNENLARIATRGGDIASLSGSPSLASASTTTTTPADEAFLKERKARQDKILDVALKKKWLREQKAEIDAKLVDHNDDDSSLYDEQTKRGLIKKMKKVVKKTAKSGAKAAANVVVVDPKRSIRGGYKVAPDEFDDETTRTARPQSFEKKEKNKKKEKRVRSKKSKKKGSEKGGPESTTSPLSKKAKKGKTKSSKSEEKAKSARLHDSMSDMFPDFQLTEDSKVIWWDI